MSQNTHKDVQNYYGIVLQQTEDLKTNACCTEETIPYTHRKILAKIHAEVLSRFYGCGSPIPESLAGLKVLDLGCGTGRDAYLCSALVGESGYVTGVDMTDKQLDTAKKYIDFHTEEFGFKKTNVRFKKAFIEDLKSADIADNSQDVVISNCVVNLAEDKLKVFKEVFRVLKTGGELYFSDVFADRRIPQNLKDDPELYGECLSGAMYIEDFRRMMLQCGVQDYRIIKQRQLTIENEELEAKIGQIKFYSITIRAFKLDLEDQCEDFGQAVKYLGTIKDYPLAFDLDDHHCFETGRWQLVCGNTVAMLKQTRFAPHFELIGDQSQHFGLFDCSDASVSNKDGELAGCC